MADDAELIAFAEKGRIVLFPPRDALLRIGDMETMYTVTGRDGLVVLDKRDRSAAPHVIIASPELAVVRRYLVQLIGVAVRAQLRLPRVVSPVEDSALPASFSLEEDPTGLTLGWTEDGSERSAWFPPGRRFDAVSFAQFAEADEDAIMQSMLDARGGRLFSII